MGKNRNFVRKYEKIGMLDALQSGASDLNVFVWFRLSNQLHS